VILVLLISSRITAADPKPAFSLNADISQWAATYAPTNPAVQTLRSLGISNLTLQLCVENNELFAAARIDTAIPEAQLQWLAMTDLIEFEPTDEHTFKWIPSDDQRKKIGTDIVDDLLIRFSGNSVFIAPDNRLTYAETVLEPSSIHLMHCSIDAAPLLTPLFASLDGIVAAETNDFSKGIMSTMLDTLKKGAAAIRDFPSVSVSIHPAADSSRRMNLSLVFSNEVTAASLQSFFSSAPTAWKNPDISEKQLGLLELMESDYHTSMHRDGCTLHLEYHWPEANDKELFADIAGALLGSLFSFHSRDDYPLIPTKIMPAPVWTDGVEVDPAAAAQAIHDATFLDNQWNSLVQFEVDYLDLPNPELIDSAVSNLVLLDENGVNIGATKRQGRLNPDILNRSTLTVSKAGEHEGTAAETASFTLHLSVATGIESHTVTPDQPLVEKADGGIFLIGISNSVVQLRSKGFSLREAKIHAKNKDGEYLSRQGASWSDARFSGRFKGCPVEVEVVVATERIPVMVQYTDIPVSKDDRIKVPSEPDADVTTRYTMKPGRKYTDPDAAAFAAGRMELIDREIRQATEYELCFPRNRDVPVQTFSMNSYLAGGDAFAYQGGTYSYSDTEFKWSLAQTNLLASATALFGEVSATFWSGIGAYSTALSTNPVPLMNGSELPSAHVEHNVVWVTANQGGHILDVQAYDAAGRQLKPGTRRTSRNASYGYFFWGLPARTTVTYAKTNLALTAPFEIELKPGGLAAIPEAKKNVEPFEAFVGELEEIAVNSQHIGDLLSASYYAHDGGRQLENIPTEVAHSDPAGAELFGYEVKPYKGYHITRVPQATKNDKVKTDRTWSGGTFSAGAYGSGFLLAIPVSSKDPAILSLWSAVYINYNDCSRLEEVEYDTRKLQEAGWIQIR
jgi:hypothetical protein